jgi:serine protease Do
MNSSVSLHRKLSLLLISGMFLLSAHIEAPGAPVVTADAVQDAFVRAAERITPSVVTIYVERRTADGNNTPNSGEEPSTSFRMPDGESSGLGSGVVVEHDGTILTNYHVVKNATLIRVLFNTNENRPERAIARILGFDEESDLAVLQLIDPATLRTPLKPAVFADSDKVRVGDWSIAVGAPFDQAHSVTVGVISAKSRHLDKDNRLSLQDYLQTDASINPGNSGGPLLNLNGEVIGINTAILSPSRYNVGIGFAVPSNAALSYWPRLKAGEAIQRGFLGIRYLPIDDAVARELNIAGGMQIGGLAQRNGKYLGPAQAAGLGEGDVITHVNGQNVTTTQEFRRAVATLPPGTKVEFTVLRPQLADGQKQTFTVTLGNWNDQFEQKTKQAAVPSKATGFTRSGMRLAEIEKLLPAARTEMGVEDDEKGVMILEVLPGSPADIAQLQRGLRIQKIRVDGKEWQDILNPTSFTQIEDNLSSKARILLQTRDRQKTFLYKAIELP